MTQYPVIHLIDSQAGGKGKSLLTRVLAHYSALHHYAVHLIDADAGKKNIKPFYPDTLEIAISAEQYWGADAVMASLEQGLSVILNLPAGAHAPLIRWFEDDGILDLKLAPSTVAGQPFELDPEQGEPIRVIKWFLCDATPDSLSDFKQSVHYFTEHYPKRVKHVLVQNYGLSPTYAWDLVNDEELVKLVQQPGIQVIRFPLFPMRERDRLQGLQWTFEQAIAKSSEFSTTERQRIVTFLKKSMAVIEATELWKDLPRWDESNVSSPKGSARGHGNGNGRQKPTDSSKDSSKEPAETVAT
jgi:hypothetical protein